MRLIDANALMVWLVNMLNEFDDGNDPHEIKREMFQVVLAKTRKMPTVDGWISVSDRLPSEEDYRQCHETWDGAVIWTNGYDIGLGCYHNYARNWADIYDCYIDDVTHWMPLPELPKEEDDDNNNH